MVKKTENTLECTATKTPLISVPVDLSLLLDTKNFNMQCSSAHHPLQSFMLAFHRKEHMKVGWGSRVERKLAGLLVYSKAKLTTQHIPCLCQTRQSGESEL